MEEILLIALGAVIGLSFATAIMSAVFVVVILIMIFADRRG